MPVRHTSDVGGEVHWTLQFCAKWQMGSVFATLASAASEVEDRTTRKATPHAWNHNAGHNMWSEPKKTEDIVRGQMPARLNPHGSIGFLNV